MATMVLESSTEARLCRSAGAFDICHLFLTRYTCTGLHSSQVLDCSADADGYIQLRGNDLPSLANLVHEKARKDSEKSGVHEYMQYMNVFSRCSLVSLCNKSPPQRPMPFCRCAGEVGCEKILLNAGVALLIPRGLNQVMKDSNAWPSEGQNCVLSPPSSLTRLTLCGQNQ